MIKYALKCHDCNHRFDSWFNDSASYDKLEASGMLSCPSCGSVNVSKALMAPSVRDTSKRQHEREYTPEDVLRFVYANSEDVGSRFVEEVRKRHKSGEPLERPIIGKASVKDYESLREDGIDVLPIPPRPKDDA